MNKNVSLAIEKAVGRLSLGKGHNNNNKDLKDNGPKKPDLFSLSGDCLLYTSPSPRD